MARTNPTQFTRPKPTPSALAGKEQIIEISSSSEEDEGSDADSHRSLTVEASKVQRKTGESGQLRTKTLRTQSSFSRNSFSDEPFKAPSSPNKASARARRVIYSSSSEDELPSPSKLIPKSTSKGKTRVSAAEVDVIEISSDSELSEEGGAEEQILIVGIPPAPPPSKPKPKEDMPLFFPGDDDDDEDGAILILNEPKSARRPIPVTPQHRPTPSTSRKIPLPGLQTVDLPDFGSDGGAPKRNTKTKIRQADPTPVAFPGTPVNGSRTFISHPTPAPRPRKTKQLSGDGQDAGPSRGGRPTTPPRAHTQPNPFILDTPQTPQSTARRTPGAPRTTKKSLQQAEQKRRAEYAQDLFNELNEVVFGGGLPSETKLAWSARLLTTAGRAKWKRTRTMSAMGGDEDGGGRREVVTDDTEIELAVKILDCDERIRNTLSHEMCHLACWIINENPKEGHGKIFKSWATKIMRKRPDIEITTRHDYDITYPYQWECGNCAKIYGRFSRSIRPDEVVCGACKTGKLEPLFTVRTRGGDPTKTPKTKAGSKLAAGKARDSPRSVPRIGKDSKHGASDSDGEEGTPEDPDDVFRRIMDGVGGLRL
ncbi:uncharacterized protein STEHIDRAFT_135188 [Stereum hirsutum FP-91666 SS1]|uniref:uncharacterized protein n=1 Tax=Stereum hirsutum (strain FP-91666) TaxID=721885 RepID=UPI000444A0C5|nr:uncharacterized protein STEHIDRAFT_135188 [Stereum hirsutum FP-91666 SS1]EIM80885.1 hypothetical protein STEHIDRAFT_135188 [Stereum hirsutum FP-91666 SS1]